MNKRKTNLLLISSIVIMVMSLGIIIGFSLWVVGVKQEIVPTYSFEDLFSKNLTLETTYLGDYVTIDDIDTSKFKISINQDRFTISYLNEYKKPLSDTNPDNPYPKDAGNYIVKITSKTLKDKDGNLRSVDVPFKVHKLDPSVDNEQDVTTEDTINGQTTSWQNNVPISSSEIANLKMSDKTTDGYVYYLQRVPITTQTNSRIKPLANQTKFVRVKVEGTFTIHDGQELKVGNNLYNCKFTPNDTKNFNELSNIEVEIIVAATVKLKDSSGNLIENSTYYSNKEGKIDEPNQSFVPAPSKEGYEFGGWKNSTTGEIWNFTNDKVNDDVELIATEKPIEYTITYNLDGGTNNQGNPETYTIETETFSLLPPTRTGYKFLGWSESGSTDILTDVTITKGSTGDLSFTANWKSAVKIPTASSTIFTYNGEDQTYDLEYDTDNCTISNNIQKNAGTYTVTLSLKDSTYEWEDGTNTNKTYEFIINKKKLTATYDVEITNVTIPSAKSIIEYTDDINVSVVNLVINGLMASDDGNIEYVYSLTDSSQANVATSSSTSEQNYIFTDTLSISNSYFAIITMKSNDSNYEFESSNNKKFAVDKLRVYVKNEVLEQSVTDTRSWTEAKTFLNSNVKFIRYLTKEEISVDSAYGGKVIGMQDGQFKYGEPLENKSLNNKIKITKTEGDSLEIATNAGRYLVGSTYYAYYKVEGLYQMVNMDDGSDINANDYLVYKYKTAYTNGAYYTIEDALINSSSNVFMWGDVPEKTTDGYGLTTFTSIRSLYSDISEYNLSNRNIYAPYTLNSSSDHDTAGTGSNVFSCLIIPSCITINLKGSSELVACASIANGSQGAVASRQRGVIYNNGTINAYDTAIIKAYGYIKGMGKLNLYGNSKAYDVLRTINFSGGSAATSNMNITSRELQVVPFSEYTIHNISCETKITSNVEYYGYFKTTISNKNVEQNVLIIGKTDSSSCLFKAKSVSNNNYIIKRAANGVNKSTDTNLYNITGSNQYYDAGQRDIIDIYGDYTDGSISISITMTIDLPILGEKEVSASIKTSTSLLLPISYMHITIKNGGNLELTNSDYMFLPGTSLMIEENATCTVGSEVDVNIAPFSVINKTYMSHCVDTFDAKLIVNGTLNVAGNIGGFISVESLSGKLNITGKADSYYDLYYTSNEPYRIKGNLSARGYLALSANTRKESNMANGVYIPIETGINEFAWGQSEGRLVYVLNNGSDPIDGDPYSLVDGAVTITEPEIDNPTRVHYRFDGWYTDETYSTPAFPFELYVSSKVYAKWDPIDYNITYEYVYNNCSPTGGRITNNNSTVANCEDVIDLVNAIDGNLVFAGWYTDQTCQNQITQITNTTSDRTIYGLWYQEGTITITINYEFDVEDKEIKDMLKLAGITIEKDSDEIISTNTSWTPNQLGTSYNNNTEFAYWFDCWYFDSDHNTKFNTADFTAMLENMTSDTSEGEKEITLHGIVRNKNRLVFEKDDSIFTYDNYESLEKVYLYPNQKYNLPTGTDLSTDLGLMNSATYIARFEGLSISATNEIKNPGDEIVFSTAYSDDIIIKPVKSEYYKVLITTIDNATVSVTASNTIKSDGSIASQTINSVGSYIFVKKGTSFEYTIVANKDNFSYSLKDTYQSYISKYTINYYLPSSDMVNLTDSATQVRQRDKWYNSWTYDTKSFSKETTNPNKIYIN